MARGKSYKQPEEQKDKLLFNGSLKLLVHTLGV